MSNKNDPFNYANVQHKTTRDINVQDSDLESIAGSVQKQNDNDVTPGELITPGGPDHHPGFFSSIGNLLGLKKNDNETPGNDDQYDENGDPIFQWEEFPWAKYLVTENIITKWK